MSAGSGALMKLIGQPVIDKAAAHQRHHHEAASDDPLLFSNGTAWKIICVTMVTSPAVQAGLSAADEPERSGSLLKLSLSVKV